MKLRIIYTFIALLFCGVLFLNNSDGRATAQNEGNTGAPNDNSTNNRTCQTCHNTGSFAVTPLLEITDSEGNPVTDNFDGGQTYSVKMTVNATGGSFGYGFQMVALNAATGVDGTPVNTWSVPTGSTNVQVATIGNGRQYAEQNGVSLNKEFVMEWTAPANGDVTFYYGGNAVDNDNMTAGDNAIMSSSSFTTTPTATNDLEKNIALNISPNPVTDMLNLVTESQISDTYELSLFDQNGRNIFTKNINISVGENINSIEMNDFPTGIYNLTLSDGKNIITKKVVKL